MINKDLSKACTIELDQSPEDNGRKHDHLTVKLDSILLNRYLGFPIMILCFTILFAVSFTLGAPVSDWLGSLLDQAAIAAEKSSLGRSLPPLIMSLFTDGILRGIGSALAFFPQMIIFFTFYTLISDTGYSARIAYLMRQPMARINMDRRSFTPLIVGFSCSVPAIISTRDIPNRVDRLIMMIVSTFTPCAARIGVILYIAGAFFTPAHATIVMSSLIILSWLVGALISYIIKRRFPVTENSAQANVLPVYHIP
ncbi:MAG: nucleoside recognition domain-containing protein, partial [Syntrophomonadaceae bacterium]